MENWGNFTIVDFFMKLVPQCHVAIFCLALSAIFIYPWPSIAEQELGTYYVYSRPTTTIICGSVKIAEDAENRACLYLVCFGEAKLASWLHALC